MATEKASDTASDSSATSKARSAAQQLSANRVVASDASEAELLAGVTAIAAEALVHTNEASLVAAKLSESANRLSAESMLYAAEAVPVRLQAEQLSAEVSIVAAENVEVANALNTLRQGGKDSLNAQTLLESAEASLSSAMVVFNSAESADAVNQSRVDD